MIWESIDSLYEEEKWDILSHAIFRSNRWTRDVEYGESMFKRGLIDSSYTHDRLVNFARFEEVCDLFNINLLAVVRLARVRREANLRGLTFIEYWPMYQILDDLPERLIRDESGNWKDQNCSGRILRYYEDKKMS